MEPRSKGRVRELGAATMSSLHGVPGTVRGTMPVAEFARQPLTEPIRSACSPPLRDVLRRTTHDVHERLHRHAGLAAVAAGTIDRRGYTALLARLYGFHRPFEAMARIAPERRGWLESDLAALGVDARARAALPRCDEFPSRATPRHVLGALYVVEGSALGGRGLARQLDGLLGHGVLDGRRFFGGHGGATGRVWRAYLARLAAASTAPADRSAIVGGATATFAIFERWLDGWDQDHG